MAQLLTYLMLIVNVLFYFKFILEKRKKATNNRIGSSKFIQ